MSICIYSRVKGKKINVEILEKVIEDLGFFSNGSVKEIGRTCISYEDIKDDTEIISFVNERTFPYNIYESSITGDYEYAQLLVFDIKKERALKEEYEKVICFCDHLRKEINSEMLLTSDIYDDICLLEERNIIWSHTFPFRYDTGDLKLEA